MVPIESQYLLCRLSSRFIFYRNKNVSKKIKKKLIKITIIEIIEWFSFLANEMQTIRQTEHSTLILRVLVCFNFSLFISDFSFAFVSHLPVYPFSIFFIWSMKRLHKWNLLFKELKILDSSNECTSATVAKQELVHSYQKSKQTNWKRKCINKCAFCCLFLIPRCCLEIFWAIQASEVSYCLWC